MDGLIVIDSRSDKHDYFLLFESYMLHLKLYLTILLQIFFYNLKLFFLYMIYIYNIQKPSKIINHDLFPSKIQSNITYKNIIGQLKNFYV